MVREVSVACRKCISNVQERGTWLRANTFWSSLFVEGVTGLCRVFNNECCMVTNFTKSANMEYMAIFCHTLPTLSWVFKK